MLMFRPEGRSEHTKVLSILRCDTLRIYSIYELIKDMFPGKPFAHPETKEIERCQSLLESASRLYIALFPVGMPGIREAGTCMKQPSLS
jgi:hypothetical protein